MDTNAEAERENEKKKWPPMHRDDGRHSMANVKLVLNNAYNWIKIWLTCAHPLENKGFFQFRSAKVPGNVINFN